MGNYETLVKLQKSLFDRVKVIVRVGGHRSREIDMGIGLIQGIILPPILFNVYIISYPGR